MGELAVAGRRAPARAPRVAETPASEITTPQRLLLWAVTLMPLHTALTISLGFPLKPSEILILFATALAITQPVRVRMARPHVPLAGTEKLVWVLSVLLVFSALATLTRPDPTGRDFGFKGSPSFDVILYTYYGLLVVVMWLHLRRLPRSLFEKAIVRSIWVAFALSVLQIVLTLGGYGSLLSTLHYTAVPLGRPLPGLGALPRNGSFPYGQQLGPWAVVAGIIAWRARKRLAVAACLAMLVQSQSTGAVLALAAALALVVVLRPTFNNFTRVTAALMISVLAVLTVPALDSLAVNQLGKLGLVQTPDEWITASKNLRSAKASAGWAMMADHPLLGVGPDRYGVYYYDYLKRVSPTEFSYIGTIPPGRAVAENNYAQVGAELGAPALLVFSLFVWGYVWRARRSGYLVGIATAVAVAMWTQQSWTFLPLWVFLAYVASSLHELDELDGPSVAATRAPATVPPAPRGRPGRRAVRLGSPRAAAGRR